MGLANGIELTESNVPRLCEVVWKTQVSAKTLEAINSDIGELLEEILTTPPLDSAELHAFPSVKFVPFMESPSRWKLVFLQMMVSLPSEALIAPLKSKLLSSTSGNSSTPEVSFNLNALLTLVSTIAVCWKGGTSLICDLLHDLLVQIFSSSSSTTTTAIITDTTDSQSPDPESDLVALLDDSLSSQSLPGAPIAKDQDPTEWRFIQLRHALLFARQLACEDTRVTGFVYAHWWREAFCSAPGQGGVLVTRRSLEFLAASMLRLLPHEGSARHLAAQLNTGQPFWSTGSGQTEGEACCSKWSEYVDVARGALAELRLHSVTAFTTPKTPTIGMASDAAPAWTEELTALVEEFARTRKMPSALIEMQLFRAQHLLNSVLPALRAGPPPLLEQGELVGACEELVRCLEARLGPRQRKTNVRVGGKRGARRK